MPETVPECRYCDEQHDPRFLCDPAKRVLDALAERGQRFDMPTVEFPEPINHADVLGEDTVLVAQFVVQAGLLPVAGVTRPVLIFTGRDSDGHVLPMWLYPGAPPDIRKAIKLVSDMGEMAIRRARQAGGGR